MNDEIEIVKRLTGVTDDSLIELHDGGFSSRGYVIDKGRIVFKFPRHSDVKYDNEISILKSLNSLGLGVNLQSVGWVSDDNSYLGLYGVVGERLCDLDLSQTQRQSIGDQLGVFLRALHEAKIECGYRLSLDEELNGWQHRYESVLGFIKSEFSARDQEIIEYLMTCHMTKTLKSLGEHLVFSHGDLDEGQIFIDTDGKIGVIDFNEAGMFDEAADFMDVDSDELRDIMLDSYGASDELRRKVELRKDIRPIIALSAFLERGDQETASKFVQEIRRILPRYGIGNRHPSSQPHDDLPFVGNYSMPGCEGDKP